MAQPVSQLAVYPGATRHSFSQLLTLRRISEVFSGGTCRKEVERAHLEGPLRQRLTVGRFPVPKFTGKTNWMGIVESI